MIVAKPQRARGELPRHCWQRNRALHAGDADLGYLRVFTESSAQDINGDGVVEYAQVGALTEPPHTSGELFPPPGSWAIHNTEVYGNRAYSSWYSNGIVAVDLSDLTAPRMVGQLVPPTNKWFASSLGMG